MKAEPKQYYFQKLYQKNRTLFVLICILLFLHINANFLVGGQQTPFFNWSLYSMPQAAQDIYSFYELRYNGDKKVVFSHTWKQPQQLFYLNTLNHYTSMRLHENNDPLKDYIDNWNSAHPIVKDMFPGLKFYPDAVEMKKFPAWYAKKIHQLTGDVVDSMNVYRIQVRYKEDGSVEKISSEFLFNLK